MKNFFLNLQTKKQTIKLSLLFLCKKSFLLLFFQFFFYSIYAQCPTITITPEVEMDGCEATITVTASGIIDGSEISGITISNNIDNLGTGNIEESLSSQCLGESGPAGGFGETFNPPISLTNILSSCDNGDNTFTLFEGTISGNEDDCISIDVGSFRMLTANGFCESNNPAPIEICFEGGLINGYVNSGCGGAAMEGIEMTIENSNGEIVGTTTTDASGYYEYPICAGENLNVYASTVCPEPCAMHTTFDAILIRKLILGLATQEDEDFISSIFGGDFNGDGNITTADIICIIRTALGINILGSENDCASGNDNFCNFLPVSEEIGVLVNYNPATDPVPSAEDYSNSATVTVNTNGTTTNNFHAFGDGDTNCSCEDPTETAVNNTETVTIEPTRNRGGIKAILANNKDMDMISLELDLPNSEVTMFSFNSPLNGMDWFYNIVGDKLKVVGLKSEDAVFNTSSDILFEVNLNGASAAQVSIDGNAENLLLRTDGTLFDLVEGENNSLTIPVNNSFNFDKYFQNGNELNIELDSEKENTLQVYLVDILGNRINSQIVSLIEGSNIIKMDLLQSEGLYFIQVTDGEYQATEKIFLFR